MELNDICELIVDCEHKTAPTQETGYPSIRTPNIGRGRFLLDGVNRVSEETYRLWTRRAVPQAGDLIMAREAPVGNVAMIPEGLHPCLGQRTLLIRPDRAKVEPSFLNYFINGPHVQGLIHAKTNGATVAHLNMKDVRTMALPELPPLPVQRRIAGILSAYDELIENSQRRIRLLEDMARALYREWFVHFRFPGHESVPRLPSPLGDIPQGWECVTLGSIIKVTHGCAFQGSHFSEEPTSRVLATPGNFRVGGGIKYDKLKFYSEEGPLESAYVFEPMDLMVTMTDLSKAGDTLGFPAFIPKLKGLSFLHNQRVGRVLPIDEFFPKYFLYCLFCDERYRHHIVGGATGLAVKHTSPSRIMDYTTAIPQNRKLIHTFENFARPVFQQINILIEAVENLRHTRDLLLPRLLSRQVTINEN